MGATKEINFGGRSWAWPADDSKLLQVVDQVRDVSFVMQHVAKRDVCVQAGGACGVWPYYLAEWFGKVITFEPDSTNYECLQKNNAGRTNVQAYNCALGARYGTGKMQLHETEQGNAGAGYVVAGDDFEICWVDYLLLPACDLLQLDVEGMEYDVLVGAAQTIAKYSPVIVIEEKALPQNLHKPTAAREYLQSIGYREVARMHRDVVFARAPA